MNAISWNRFLSTASTCVTMLVLLSVSSFATDEQDKAPWQAKRCAVVLTYDDALNVHLDNVVPLLDSLGFKGTFYVPCSFPGFRERVSDWISVAKEGHELGNHTLFHPCEGGIPGREWVQPDYDLRTYSVRRIVDEIEMANMLLQLMDGDTLRTFAYPCGEMKAGDSSYVDEIKKVFLGARGVAPRMQKMQDIDLYNVGAYLVNGQSGDELIRLVQEAMERNALLVFLFHGVGGEHSLNVSLRDHRTLLYFLKQNERDIWVAPLREICRYLKEQ
jgi:peptidoglycan/xylan/chitin deacetylase (PgdA/CDA1 family)